MWHFCTRKMTNFELEDDFGKLVLYTQRFHTPACPLGRRDFNRLSKSLNVTLSKRRDPEYGPSDDITFRGDERVSFRIVDSTCQITVGNRTRLIPKISYLPINDRVLHFCWQIELTPIEKKVIKAFTDFLRTHRVLLTGQFACLQNIRSHITRGNMHCQMEADRPVPLHVQSMSRSWCADEAGILIGEREDGKHLYHFDRDGLSCKEYGEHEYIYAGCEIQTSDSETLQETMDAGYFAARAVAIQDLAIE